MILEIDEFGAFLSKKQDSFVVKKAEEKHEYPAKNIESIVMHPGCSMSTDAIKLCLECGVNLILCKRNGAPIGRFWYSSLGKNSEIRRKQYLLPGTELETELSRRIVSRKLSGQRKLLNDMKNNRDSETEELIEALTSIEVTLPKISSAGKKSLLGMEGNCSKRYFRAISSLMPENFKFSKRNRRPSEDRFNCVMNYYYGFGYRQAENAIVVNGLDPNAGIYHCDQYGKPTLSFDVVEIMRPTIDRLIIYLISKHRIKDEFFDFSDSSCLLTKTGRKSLAEAYFERSEADLKDISWGFCREVVEALSNAKF